MNFHTALSSSGEGGGLYIKEQRDIAANTESPAIITVVRQCI